MGYILESSHFPATASYTKKSVEELESAGEDEIDPSKEDPLDFALWKFSGIERRYGQALGGMGGQAGI